MEKQTLANKPSSILTIIMILLFASCVPTKVYRGSSFTDFTKYDDFYLSQSSSVDFKYTTIGLVSSMIRTGYVKTKKMTNREFKEKWKAEKERKKVEGNSYIKQSSDSPYAGYTLYAASAQEAIDILVDQAKKVGANGILNIQIEYVPSDLKQINSGYSASGMAIKK